jgi:mRNA-degrading endonuclease RelE of RelBE toxin-antitoxin system
MHHPLAVESLSKLDDPVRRQIVERLKILEIQPKKGKRLRIGRFHSLRLGDFRAIYEIWGDQRMVVVLLIDRRKNVYEELDRLY